MLVVTIVIIIRRKMWSELKYMDFCYYVCLFFSKSCKNYKNGLGQICKGVLLPAMQEATLQVTLTGRRMTEISTYSGGQYPTFFMDFKNPFSKLPAMHQATFFQWGAWKHIWIGKLALKIVLLFKLAKLYFPIPEHQILMDFFCGHYMYSVSVKLS